MARKRTLTNLWADVALYADVPAFSSATKPTQAQVTAMLNRSLYDLANIVKKDGLWFKTDTIAVTSGTTSYALPTDFSSLRYLRYSEGGERRKICKGSVDVMDRASSYNAGWTNERARYWLPAGSKTIYFTDPRGSYTVTVGYVPDLVAFDTNDTAIAELSTSTDYILSDGGVDEWIALDVAIRIAGIIEERDTSAQERRQDLTFERLLEHFNNRDIDEPEAVRNTWDHCDSEYYD